MSGNLPMGIAGNVPRVRYSAAYPTMRRRSYASEGSRTKCARRDRKGPRAERVLRRGNYCVTLTVSEGSDPKNTL